MAELLQKKKNNTSQKKTLTLENKLNIVMITLRREE